VVVRQMLLATGFQHVELVDLTVPRFPGTLRSKLRTRQIRIARRVVGFGLRLLGLKSPAIWSNSVIALAWKGR
jgi:hypothetical protein